MPYWHTPQPNLCHVSHLTRQGVEWIDIMKRTIAILALAALGITAANAGVRFGINFGIPVPVPVGRGSSASLRTTANQLLTINGTVAISKTW